MGTIALHRSVFVRLVVIMLAMAALLLTLVGGFYFVLVLPGLHKSVNDVVGAHVRAIADSQPDQASVHRFLSRLDMEVRFEGPDGAWTTDPSLPTLDEVDRMHRTGFLGHLRFVLHPPERRYYVAQTPAGHYIFAPRIGTRLAEAHNDMLLLLLVVMVGVFLTAYFVLKRALAPLRLLGAGVQQLSEGQLDVVVPKRSEDEFGVLTDAFNRMARQVRGMVQDRERLLLDVSHELRSPLTRLKVALEMVPDDSQKRSMAADVVEMENLVTELLELHRLGGAEGLRLEKVDVVALVHEVCAREAQRAPGVRITAQPAEAVILAEADGIRSVLRNVIDNALKYSLPDSRPVEVDIEADSSDIRVVVRDDGRGVATQETARLFEPFTRLDPSRSKQTGGFGLGLSICKRIVEAHGGSIAIESRRPRGVICSMRFPLKTAGSGIAAE